MANVSRIMESKDYSKFKPTAFNRDVRKIKRLVDSMKKHGFIAAYPLHCVRDDKGKLQVKAGHHRLEAAKKLGIAVFYVITEDTATVHELERATNPWKIDDYVISHIRAGSASHRELRELSQRSGIAESLVASMLVGDLATSCNANNSLKDGTFEIKDRTHFLHVENIVLQLKSICEFATARNFVGALSILCYVAEFDAPTFIHKCKISPSLLVKQATKKQYIELFETIYNHAARQRTPLAFLASEKTKERMSVEVKRAKLVDA